MDITPETSTWGGAESGRELSLEAGGGGGTRSRTAHRRAIFLKERQRVDRIASWEHSPERSHGAGGGRGESGFSRCAEGNDHYTEHGTLRPDRGRSPRGRTTPNLQPLSLRMYLGSLPDFRVRLCCS